ncbi:PEP-CTERM sorting domain-containing protein, partial [Cephaloticoccus capnophilus]|uniref:PEP-CTERM sorting domain-containing protein n=1 Tax=Cephaloticoccus capnophilus TaxID=1548208 RepID=UPI0012E7B3A2
NIQLEANKGVSLTGDRRINSLRTSSNKENRFVNLNGRKLTIGAGGVVMEGGRSHIISNGILTSSVGNIKFTAVGNQVYHKLPVRTAIANNGNIKVGLEITNTSTAYNGIGLVGEQSNTFTGDVNVIGRAQLDLSKTNGAVAILSNLNLKEGAIVSIFRSNQIERGVRVLLKSKSQAPSVFGFNGHHRVDLKESFRELKVEGHAVVSFSLDNKEPHGRIEIALDDLNVMQGSYLLVKEWKDGRDRLLVRKNSAHVRDSLKRIEFENHDTRTVNLRDYNKNYWEIYALVPEPSTYGAVFGGAAVTLLLYHRRRRGK